MSEIVSQENIYRDVIASIELLLSETSAEELSDERITALYKGAKSQLASIREAMSRELLSLQEHAEWDAFTIAFYGETNSGKSTLVEALRILLHEETKEKDRTVYGDAYKKIIALQDKSSKINQEIKIIQEKKNNFVHEINTSIDNTIRELDEIDNRQKYAFTLIEAYNLARSDLRKNSTGDFFKVLFSRDEYSAKKFSLREEIPKLKSDFKECEKKLEGYRRRLKSESKAYEQKISPLKEDVVILEKEIKPLEVVAELHRDGQIIGNGMQDFTQEVMEYNFHINNQNLTLLDLPGIEGKESRYTELIVSALEKAHVVFYISKYARPPQNGEDKNSMISKIRKQLSGQTEVFFVYNKPVQKPEQIGTISNVGEDTLKSLREVDNIMTSLFGEKYLGNYVVSAMPAYLANSNNYGENEAAKNLKKRQNKFLKDFTPAELISNSNIDAIITWIKERLASNYKDKIRESNYYKILNCLRETEMSINGLEKDFKDLRRTIANELTSSFKAIDARLNSMVNELRDAKRMSAHQFVFKSNEILCDEIDKGIEDDELSDRIKDVFEIQSQNAINLFNRKLEELGEIYARDVADINNKYQRYFSENIVLFGDTSDLEFDFDPVIDKQNKKRNMDTAWIIGEIVGTLLFFSTNSMAVLVITILGLIVRVGRFIAKTIDPERNKAFQLQDIDQNVKNASIELEETLQNHNETVIKKIEENNQKIKARMKKSLEDLDNSIMTLEKAKNGIHKISEEYRTFGEES